MANSLYAAFFESAFRRPSAPRRPTIPGRPPATGRRPTFGPPVSQSSDDFSADIATTGFITPGSPTAGVINAPADSDWFSVNLQAGRVYNINVTGISLSDTLLTIRDSRGSLLAENDDINPDVNLNSQLSFSPNVSGTYFLDVRGFRNQTGSYELRVEESLPTNPTPQSGFQIDINYAGDPRYLPFFQEAAARWQEVITGDLPDVNGIDDLLVTVNVGPIDGSGGTLGFAGPDSFRSNALGGLPLTGSTTLDSADLVSLEAGGILDDTVLHEFGHILGIGTIWDRTGFLSGSEYIGANAVREYQKLGGQNSSVPLETNGGPGTALSHWSEAVFDKELMTGFIDRQSNPLSIFTIGSLQDLGYNVNYAAADSYSLPSSARSIGDQPTVAAMGDALLSSLSVCFCATCAALSMPGFDLSKFSAQVNTLETSSAGSAATSDIQVSEVLFAPLLALPPYLDAGQRVDYTFPPDSIEKLPILSLSDSPSILL